MTAAITDFAQFTDLRSRAADNDPETLREVAGQFEALFVQSLLKNMRDSSLADPIFGQSDQHDMYQDMMDQQLSLEMASGRGIGLAEMLTSQLGGRRVPESPDGRVTSPVVSPQRTTENALPAWSSAEDFVQDIWPHAKRAGAKLNVAPEAILAQAALETGWGAHVMRRHDGSSSFNLFGIKAGAEWSGDRVAKATLEFDRGIARSEVAQFRSYSDVAEPFDDYEALLRDNPRYSSVRDHGDDIDGFATALQSAGYATDPNYAEKIKAVHNSATMKNALSGLKSGNDLPIDSSVAEETT